MCNKWHGHRFGSWETVKEETLHIRYADIWYEDEDYAYSKWVLTQKRTCIYCQYVQINKQEVKFF